ncbi:hypothetical protein DPMN_100134 [Dreissena polymorpha]|uniref:Uncharacterized protein n=1 Tax=Dreissena polymorpha TaxID=45954 RepID=A0A9D4LFD4_DREPO|nr:hypothetical protein DPMN_100134 [Dreissena polymorpha]
MIMSEIRWTLETFSIQRSAKRTTALTRPFSFPHKKNVYVVSFPLMNLVWLEVSRPAHLCS